MVLSSEDIRECPAGVIIEALGHIPRLEALEPLQERIWGFAARQIVPAHVLYMAAATGGIVLAAYDGARPVGFAFGFLARLEGRLYHASHMAGVDPDYQGRGIGAALKWRQRGQALAQGLDLMTWTFDPLEARNAHFNLRKLGAISRTYQVDLYGTLGDRLNRDLPTDRLLVEWQLRLPAAPADDSEGEPTPILRNAGEAPVLDLPQSESAAPLVVHTPADIQRLKRQAPATALAWRLAVRQALTWALDRGYTIVSYRDGAYRLTRHPGALPMY